MLEFQCSSCGQQMKAKEQYAGLNCKCPKCETSLKIPDTATVPTEQPYQSPSDEQSPAATETYNQNFPEESTLYEGSSPAGQTTHESQCEEETFSGSPVSSHVHSPISNLYAGFWKRFAAAFIDGILLNMVGTGLGMVVGFFIGLAMSGMGAAQEAIIFTAQIAAFLLASIMRLLYFSIMESSSLQGTLGKMALGIKVTDLNGNRISFPHAIGRNLAKIVSSLTLFIGYMMAGWTEKKQALHDMIASTLVVNKNKT